MAKIAIDCDGVLADFVAAFMAEVHDMWPGRVSKDHVPRNFDDFGIPKEDQAKVWDRINNTPNWWMGLEAIPENMGALAQFLLTQRDQDVHICTARKEATGMTIAKLTRAWLFACGVSGGTNYLGIIPVAKAAKKVNVYDALGIEWSIDDKGETVLECDKLEGHHAFLLDQPWNQEFTPKHRVKTVREFLDAIKAANAR